MHFNPPARKVQTAIALLQQQGFNREAFILKHLSSFAAQTTGGTNTLAIAKAYAATNFPFE